jgi:hypothetical protein
MIAATTMWRLSLCRLAPNALTILVSLCREFGFGERYEGCNMSKPEGTNGERNGETRVAMRKLTYSKARWHTACSNAVQTRLRVNAMRIY